jgi:hypothetical protein
MAIKSLDERLNQMTQVGSSAPGIKTTSYYEPAPDSTVESAVPPIESGSPTALPNEAFDENPIEMPADEPSIAKPILVAGIGSALRGIVRSVEKEVKSGVKAAPDVVKDEKIIDGVVPDATMPEDIPIVEVGGVVMPEVTDETVKALGQAVEARAAQRVAGTETSLMPPEEAFNTTRMPDNVADIVNGTADALGIKTQTVTFTEIIGKANDLGIDQKFLDRLMTNDGSMVAGAVDVYRAMQVLESSAKTLDDMFAKVNKGQAIEEDFLKLRQQITFHGLIQKSVKGLQSNTARALSIMRVPRDSSIIDIRQLLDEGGGVGSLIELAKAYGTNGLSAASKNKLLEKSMLSSVKDLWFATWINGLLSNPTTHAKNIVGNSAFGIYRVPERMLAAAFSRMPESMRVGRESLNPLSPRFNNKIPFSAQEMIAWDEGLSALESFSYSIKNAFKRGAKSFKENAPQDGLTKTELEGQYERDISADMFGVSNDRLIGKAINLYGKAITLPGRALMSEDEFFKSFFFDNSFRNQVNVRAKKVYKDSLQMGDDEASALAKAESTARDLYSNPPDDMAQMALYASRRGTFTMDLPPGLRGLERLFQTPLLKIFVPFFRTPSNIMLEVVERTPFAPLSSKFREDFARGGPSRDLSLAKVTMGSMLLYGAAEMAANGHIIGYGPGRKADRDAFLRAGGQSYSFVFPKEKFSDSQIERLSQYGKVTLTDDKVYYGFAGLEPIGAMLAIGADYTSFAKYHDSNEDINQVFGGAVYSMYNYMKEQPFLQGFSEIMSLAGGVFEGDVNVDDFINGVSKQAGGFVIGGSPLGAYSSAVGGIERYLDPERSETSIKGLDLDVGVAGFYEAYLRYKSRVPYLSDSLPEKLNLWGDVSMSGRGQVDEIVMPTRVTFGEFSPLDNELFQLGSPISMPQRTISGVELNANQYNQLIMIYAKELNAKQEMTNIIYSPGYTLLRDGIKQQTLRSVHDKLMGLARDIFVSRDFEFQNKVQELNNLKLDNIFAK